MTFCPADAGGTIEKERARIMRKKRTDKFLKQFFLMTKPPILLELLNFWAQFLLIWLTPPFFTNNNVISTSIQAGHLTAKVIIEDITNEEA